MNKLIKLASILVVAMLVGCTTPGQGGAPQDKANDVDILDQKTVSYEFTYQTAECRYFLMVNTTIYAYFRRSFKWSNS